jgi:hypothetical protein
MNLRGAHAVLALIAEVVAFYRALGYSVEERVSLGRRL